MKIITLRIDEEEKARLERLAESGNVTLSRALREGAALYLSDVQAKVHRARGGDATFLGVRRDNAGRPVNATSAATSTELKLLGRLRAHMYDGGFQSLRRSLDQGTDPGVVLAGLGHWLDMVGKLYAADRSEIGWSWFVKDYCPGYSHEGAVAPLRRLIHSSLVADIDANIAGILDAIDAGFRRLLDDVEKLELVRRAVLPAWQVLEGEIK
jgi:hypothetical protein